MFDNQDVYKDLKEGSVLVVDEDFLSGSVVIGSEVVTNVKVSSFAGER